MRAKIRMHGHDLRNRLEDPSSDGRLVGGRLSAEGLGSAGQFGRSDRDARLGQQPMEVAKTRAVGQPRDHPAEAQHPYLTLTPEAWLRGRVAHGNDGRIGADRDEPPGAKTGSQIHHAPIPPWDALADDELGDRTGAQDLSGLGGARERVSDLYGHAIHAIRPDGDLTGMQAEPGNGGHSS